MAPKTSKDTLHPDNFQVSPYDPDRTAPPTLQEMSQLGIKAPPDEKAISISTKVRPVVAYAIDRILEKRIYSLKDRQAFFRLALMNLISQLEHEITEGSVRVAFRRLEEQRRALAELVQMRHMADMITITQKVVKLFLSYGARFEAIQTLRRAKRFSEDIPIEGLKARYVNMLYGSPDGVERPERDSWDEAALIWDRVMDGYFDRDDEGEIRERLKIYG